ncbi:hypothetical protein Taro_011654 [Colocasia esculenta]|uniref:Uncharacterized protein n=1 Tax=Colocasia esculenta TaxID=4460 RepID=A0A843U6I7_COLES|nr:hypothetical protein [Colocasia esculenta]
MKDVVYESRLCSNPPQEQAPGSVVYQLVRVEGDGTLIPATDDEVVEVEHILEDDKKDLPSPEGSGKSQLYVSDMALSSKKSSIDSQEDLPSDPLKLDSQIYDPTWYIVSWHSLSCIILLWSNSEGSSGKLNARREYIEVMLQKVKHEEKLRLSREEPIHSPKCNNINRQYSDQHSYLPASNSIPTQEAGALFPVGLRERSVEEYPISTEIEGALTTDIHSSSYLDFPLSEHEVCLDDLTIRELQETFRVIFGRQTSVKDKLWLRRRIAMGLSNPCDIPSTGFIIKGRKIVIRNSKIGHGCAESTKNEVDLQPALQNIGSVKDEIQGLLSTPISQIQEERLSGKRLRTSLLENNSKSGSLNVEIIGSKRVRRPTKRYIEELSELETRDFCAQLMTPVKSLGGDQTSASYRCGSASNVSSQCAITRKDFLGGCGVQIPYVLRVRRGRPRTNIVTLMNAALVQEEKTVSETQRKGAASGDYLGGYADIVLRPKCSTRRKHHRAWTPREVVKLVEGVSKYGAGKWSEIKRLAFASYTYRSSVDLKDKWRNLLRACFTQRTTEKGVRILHSSLLFLLRLLLLFIISVSRNSSYVVVSTQTLTSRRPTSAPIPAPILLRVRELASRTQFQEGIGFSSAKITGRNRRDAQGKRSGFL